MSSGCTRSYSYLTALQFNVNVIKNIEYLLTVEVFAYPLSQADNPPKGNYIDMTDLRIPTLPVYDLSFFENIAELLNDEPLLERDKVMGGMLASIGIKKGKPFAPKGKGKQALEKAAWACRRTTNHH